MQRCGLKLPSTQTQARQHAASPTTHPLLVECTQHLPRGTPSQQPTHRQTLSTSLAKQPTVQAPHTCSRNSCRTAATQLHGPEPGHEHENGEGMCVHAYACGVHTCSLVGSWQLKARVHVLQPKLGDNTPPQLLMQLSATVMTTL
jgi:hypothetical protein